MIWAASCKEHATPPTNDAAASDTTYTATAEAPQRKKILIEELSGVTCVNCPQGADQLDTLMKRNPDLLEVVTIHTGALTDRIPGHSIQNFQTDDGRALRELVWGEQGNKPTAAFDRRRYGNQGNTYFVNVYTNWPDAVARAKNDGGTTPVNIYISSTYNSSQDRYEVEAKVAYTAAVTGQQALNIFLIENDIKDAQEYSTSNIDDNYIFNHVFRRAITPAVGRLFLTDRSTKEAGRVYVFRTSFKIDPTDEKQKFWKPENMKLVAFVSMSEPSDKHVLHVQETDLVP